MRLHFVVAIVALAGGCTGIIDGGGGSTASGGGGGGGGTAPDAAQTGGNPDAPTGGNPDAPSGSFVCRNQITSGLSSGHHNAGQDCMGGCHNHGFTLAGTLYTMANGSAPLTGGSITVVDANGATFDMVSQLNGNFYTSTAVKFPVTVVASSCPSVTHMVGSVSAGGCNNNGCHAAGAQGVIHLP